MAPIKTGNRGPFESTSIPLGIPILCLGIILRNKARAPVRTCEVHPQIAPNTLRLLDWLIGEGFWITYNQVALRRTKMQPFGELGSVRRVHILNGGVNLVPR